MAFKFVLCLTAILAAANAGYVAPVTTYAATPVLTKFVNPSVDAVASTQQNVVRSFGGTVSHYSKSVDTPYSSVRKVDTRINNNVYTPAVAKTVSYAAPAVSYAAPAFAKTVSYAAPSVTYAAPAVAKTVSYAAPAVTYSAPAFAKTVSYAAPSVTYAAPAVAKTVSYAAPAVTYAAPAFAKTVSYAAPAVTYSAPAVAKTVSYAAPAVTYAAPAFAKTVSYAAPAPVVYSHGAPIVKQAITYSPAASVAHVSFDGFGAHWGY